MIRPSVLAGVLAVLLLGTLPPATAQTFTMTKVDYEYDHDLDFSKLRTYAWGPLDSPAKNPANHTNIKWFVERGLEQKGLRKAPEGTRPDVEVRYAVRSERKLRGTPKSEQTSMAGAPSEVRTSVDFDRVDEGVFSIELLLPEAQKTIWQAETDFRIPDRKKVEQESRAGVARLLSKYPPPKAAPAP